jgi:hypothetical protein
MLRHLVSVVAVLVAAAGLFAGEYKGKIKSVDADKSTLTVTVTVDDKDKDVTLKVNDDTKFTTSNKKQADKLASDKLKFKAFQKGGQEVVVTTTGEGDKEVATEVKVTLGKKKDKNK